MKAIRFHRYGEPSELRWEEAPDPAPRRGQVRVEVHAAAVNPKDVLIRKGKMHPFSGVGFPQRMGQDLAGVVESVGKGVKRLRPGDEVFGMIARMGAGSYAERVTVPASCVALKPTTASMEEAAAIPLAALTALQALEDRAGLREGDEVLLNGASGGVGVYAVQLARVLGARPVAVCSRRNAELVTGLGAAEVIAYDETPLDSLERRFDVVFDIFGSLAYPKAQRLLGPRGRYVTTIPRPDTFARDLVTRFGGPHAALVVVHPYPRDLARLAQYVDLGELKPVIDRVHDVTDAAEAHRHVETKRARGKVVLRVKGD